jgi:hypothetical protein
VLDSFWGTGYNIAWMQTLYIQGRSLAPAQLDWIRGLMTEHPDWGRFQLSVPIAEQWNWRNGAGRLKDMAARTLLLKLQRRGLIGLPAGRRGGGSRPAAVPQADQLALWTEPPLEAPLGQLLPLTVRPVDGGPERGLLAKLLGEFHYLGYRRPVGENLQYLARDRQGRALAGLVFGAAAWKCAPRDHYIGWDSACRQARIHLVANNMRFLVLPWVRVRHLASHLLGLVARRLSGDWQDKYGHPIHLLETFVERGRFAGCSYRAANWLGVGLTQGRSRNDRQRALRVACKEVYLYPLGRQFRRALLAPLSPVV